MKFKLVALRKINEGYFSVPQFVKDAPNEDIAESNRRYYIEMNTKNKDNVMPMAFADNLDLVVLGEFEDSTGVTTTYNNYEVVGNLGDWLRGAGLYGKSSEVN